MILLFSLVLLTKDFVICRIDMRPLFALSVLISGLLAALSLQEYKIYKVAELIVENRIMHIKATEIEQQAYGICSFLCTEDLEFFISCFGILLGSKVIKFNLGGIDLKEVKIGSDFISFVYGTGKEIQSIKLLHGIIGEQELKLITERFRYETGIIPRIHQ